MTQVGPGELLKLVSKRKQSVNMNGTLPAREGQGAFLLILVVCACQVAGGVFQKEVAQWCLRPA